MDKYQTFLPRIGASIVDSLLMIPLIFITPFIAAFLESYMPKARFFAVILLGIVSALYVILMHTFYGQTLGKMLVKVKVVDVYEKPIIFGQAVLRSLPLVALVMFYLAFSGVEPAKDAFMNLTFAALFWFLLSLFIVVDIVTFLANKRHCALHDFIAGTIVVRTDI